MAPDTSRIERTANALAHAVERILAVALILAVSLNFLNVVGRYLGGYALLGVDEVEIYILIAIAFLGAAVTSWRGQHLRMDILVTACPPPVRALVKVIEMMIMLTVVVFVAVQSLRYVERIYALGAVSDIARIPTWLPHATVTISFAAIALVVVIRLMQKLGAIKAPVRSPKREPQP